MLLIGGMSLGALGGATVARNRPACNPVVQSRYASDLARDPTLDHGCDRASRNDVVDELPRHEFTGRGIDQHLAGPEHAIIVAALARKSLVASV